MYDNISDDATVLIDTIVNTITGLLTSGNVTVEQLLNQIKDQLYGWGNELKMQFSGLFGWINTLFSDVNTIFVEASHTMQRMFGQMFENIMTQARMVVTDTTTRFVEVIRRIQDDTARLYQDIAVRFDRSLQVLSNQYNSIVSITQSFLKETHIYMGQLFDKMILEISKRIGVMGDVLDFYLSRFFVLLENITRLDDNAAVSIVSFIYKCFVMFKSNVKPIERSILQWEIKQ